jgi:hypothetical protein
VIKALEYEKAAVMKSLEIPSWWAPEMIIQTPHNPWNTPRTSEDKKMKGLLQGLTNNLHRLKDEMKKM